MIQIRLEGAWETERKLRSLKIKTAKKLVKKTVRKSLLPVKRACKENASSIVGGDMGQLLRKNIVIKPFKKQKPYSYGAAVRLKSNVPEFVWPPAGRQGRRQYIPAAIEYGHLSWRGAKAFVPAMPFMRIAAQQSLPKAKTEFHQRLKIGIEAVARGG